MLCLKKEYMQEPINGFLADGGGGGGGGGGVIDVI